MKKFYSIIALASLMLTSALSFTSCQKDELPAPQKTYVSNNGNNGNNGQSVTITSVNSQYGNSNGGAAVTTNSNQKETVADADPFTNLSGTWEYIDGDGMKCTLELSNETKSTMPFNMTCNGKKYTLSSRYQAKLTVGSMTYIGKFFTGIFLSNDGGETYTLTAQKYASSVSATSFNADIKIKGQTAAQGVTLTKVK